MSASQAEDAVSITVICSIKIKGGITMRTELAIKNRISLLRGRTTDNGNIIRKLERQLRAMQRKKDEE